MFWKHISICVPHTPYRPILNSHDTRGEGLCWNWMLGMLDTDCPDLFTIFMLWHRGWKLNDASLALIIVIYFLSNFVEMRWYVLWWPSKWHNSMITISCEGGPTVWDLDWWDTSTQNMEGNVYDIVFLAPFLAFPLFSLLSIMHLCLERKSFNQGFSSTYWNFRKPIFQVWTFPGILLDTLRFSRDISS